MSYHSTRTSFIDRLMLRLRKLPGSRHLPWPYIVAGHADAADEIPEKLVARTAVTVQSGDRHTWVAFDCPRHPNERIMLNLSTSRRPCWRINSEQPFTLYPSVDATHSGGRCHFWVRRGRLKWAAEPMGKSERTTK
ncbi:DUF6527 family protein [Lentzea sp. NPDC005914]|uniref:DUF6527 family protein n=1 Tax=Lentzea sp. NPDC005914 TaxID=3154572 RepID=UPI0034023178